MIRGPVPAEAVIAAAVAEVRATDRWQDTRSEPFPTQRAAFDALTEAYEIREAIVRRWMREHPEPVEDDGPDLFGGAS